ncbi:MAG: type II toxin-antitoxin system VapC family toxin [Dongiaceae bacterium]
MSRYLLDTNVVSEPRRKRPDPNVLRWIAGIDEGNLYLSAFTPAEIRKGIVKLGQDRRARAYEAHLEELRAQFADRILPLDDQVLDRWGQITGACEARGVVLSVIDALFAATALHYNLIFATRNTRHLRDTGVQLFNPWTASG